jgi:hypothetical protein
MLHLFLFSASVIRVSLGKAPRTHHKGDVHTKVKKEEDVLNGYGRSIHGKAAEGKKSKLEMEGLTHAD